MSLGNILTRGQPYSSSVETTKTITTDEITDTQNRNHSNDKYLVECHKVKELLGTSVEQTLNQRETLLPPVIILCSSSRNTSWVCDVTVHTVCV